MPRRNRSYSTPQKRRPQLLSQEDLPASPKQRRSMETRSRLTEAALHLFREKGYERTSIEEITERAGVAVGGFYLHFRSKRQVLLVLMDELLEKLSGLSLKMPAGTSVRSALRELLSQAFSQDLKFLGAYRAWQEATLRDTELERMERQIREWTTGRVMGVLTSLQTLQGARQDVQLASLAHTLDTHFWALMARAIHAPRVDITSWLDAASHLVYHAMFRDSAR